MNIGTGNLNNDLLLILIGSVLTFVTLSILEFLKNRAERNRKTKNFELFIKLELSTLAKTFEKLHTALSYVNYYDYLLLDRASKSIENLEKSRNDAIYLSNTAVQEKFIDLISDISTFLTGVRNIQTLYYDDINKATTGRNSNKMDKNSKRTKIPQIKIKTSAEVLVEFNQRKTEKSIEYVEIKRRLDDLIKALENKKD